MYPRIRALREDRDLKQSAVAALLHISQATYSRYESGAGHSHRGPDRFGRLLRRQHGLPFRADRPPGAISAQIEKRAPHSALFICSLCVH